MPRNYYRSDSNQKEIVEALRKVGAVVRIIEAANGQAGIPDLLVGYRGTTYLMEVKLPVGPRGGGARSKLRPEQEEFIAGWRGGPIAVVRSVTEALTAVGVMITDT
jgi:hypothetical protein